MGDPSDDNLSGGSRGSDMFDSAESASSAAEEFDSVAMWPVIRRRSHWLWGSVGSPGARRASFLRFWMADVIAWWVLDCYFWMGLRWLLLFPGGFWMVTVMSWWALFFVKLPRFAHSGPVSQHSIAVVHIPLE